jgi:hypothetical protein
MEFPKMNNPKVIEINCETGEEVIRDMTEIELAEYAQRQVLIDEAEKAKAAKAQAKAAAEAKLTALGLTADDLKALGL